MTINSPDEMIERFGPAIEGLLEDSSIRHLWRLSFLVSFFIIDKKFRFCIASRKIAGFWQKISLWLRGSQKTPSVALYHHSLKKIICIELRKNMIDGPKLWK